MYIMIVSNYLIRAHFFRVVLKEMAHELIIHCSIMYVEYIHNEDVYLPLLVKMLLQCSNIL